MSYTDYLRLEGWSSIALGVVLAGVAAPGLSTPDLWLLLLVPFAVLALALAGRASGASLWRPGEWRTEVPLRDADSDRPAMSERRLRRRVLIETAVWIGGGSAWVLATGSSSGLFVATGVLSVLFGVMQAFAARARVVETERRRGVRYVVAARPGLGLPRLGVER